MSEERESAVRPEAAADDPAAAAAAEQPSEERLAEASPDDAAGAAGRDGAEEAQAEAPAEPEPDYEDKWKRALAELDNVRKRARRDVGAAETRGIAKVARAVLPALDDLDRALGAAPEDDPMRSGVAAIQAQLLSALARLGIEPDVPEGEAFDPHRHEAVAQQPVEGAASGTIVEVYANGYHLGEEVLRAAKVVVAQ